MTTCNQLDLETLGFWPIMLKILPGEWVQGSSDSVLVYGVVFIDITNGHFIHAGPY